MLKRRKFELWTGMTWALLALFILFLVYPMYGILRQAFFSPDGRLTLAQFQKFFGTPITRRRF